MVPRMLTLDQIIYRRRLNRAQEPSETFTIESWPDVPTFSST